jgi:non-reducing end alpha-L-arabinofuranosidase
VWRLALVVVAVSLGALPVAGASADHAPRQASHHGRRHADSRRHRHKSRKRHRRRPAATVVRRPCDIYAATGTPCVAAFSSTRALFADYAGPLYEVRRASDGATMNVGVLTPGGYANAAAQDAFCAGTSCVVAKIYDQTSDHNDLVPQPPTSAIYSNNRYPHDPVSAAALPIFAGGHPVYGLKFQDGSPSSMPCTSAATCVDNHGQAYDNDHARAKGVAVGGQPEGVYGVFGGTYSGSECCFDFGNSEVKGTDDGNGAMDALNFSRACWDACGPGQGPWVQADLENGMFMTGTTTLLPESLTSLTGGSFTSGDGFCCAATSQNLAMPYPFVTGILTNPGSKTFTLEGANATSGGLTTFYAGPTPPGVGYSPMRQQGAIILGSGGDQGTSDGEFFEGAMTIGVPSSAAEAAVQASIVSVAYTMR